MRGVFCHRLGCFVGFFAISACHLEVPSTWAASGPGRGGAGELILEIANPQACYGPGNTVCYTLSMRNLTQLVTGFNAFLEFDPTQLTYQGALSSYTATPFGLHVQNLLAAEVAPGNLNFDGSVNFFPPQPPTMADALLVTICFTVNSGNDGETANILDRVVNPFQTSLSFQGTPISTTFIAPPGILLDETLPTLTCPPGQSLQCVTQIPPPIAPADYGAVAAADVCAAAQAICNGIWSGTTSSATNDGSASCGGSALTADVWYRYTPGSAGTLTVSTCGVDGGSANYNSVLSIHTNACPGLPQNELACSAGTCGPETSVSAAVSAGVTYLIRVSGSGATGDFDLAVAGPECLNGADNCDPAPKITWEGDASDGNTCPETITRTYRITDVGGNFDECGQVFVINDTIDPVIICPDVLELDCSTPLPPPANSVATFEAQGGVVSDNCQIASVAMQSQQLISGNGCAGTPYYFLRTYVVVDGCGNDRVCKQSIYQWDMSGPSITCPAAITIECDESTDPSNTGTPIVSDNCGPLNVVHSDVNDLDDCLGTGTITRTWTVTDGCNQTAQCVQIITVEDSTPPALVCPGNISVHSDPGCDGAVVTFPDPLITDNCDPAPTLIACSPPSGSVFPIGTTQVTCTAQDACMNIGNCTFDVTVSNRNTVTATVELQGVIAGSPIVRCIKFIAKNGTTCAPAEHVPVTFSGSPATGTATFTVACGDWTSLCAKDEQHTLYDTVALNDMGAQYQGASTLVLRGGDTDNDSDVDINDVTFLIFAYGGPEAFGGCPWNGSRGADFSNNGIVGAEDYTFIINNWLQISSCTCGVLATGAFVGASSIPTARLRPEVAARVDLNRDGVFDSRDVRHFEASVGLPHSLSEKMRRSASGTSTR